MNQAKRRKQIMNITTKAQKLQKSLVLELKVVRMWVRLQVKLVKEKMQKLLQSIRHLSKKLKTS